MITQTGGGCRASNYIHLLRKALKKAGYGYIPVISLNLSGLEKNSGFHWTLGLIRKLVAAMAYGRPDDAARQSSASYELTPGAADAVSKEWIERLTVRVRRPDADSRSESCAPTWRKSPPITPPCPPTARACASRSALSARSTSSSPRSRTTTSRSSSRPRAARSWCPDS